MKKGRKKFAVLLTLVCIIGAGATFSYLSTRTDLKVNTFTSSRNIEIELREPKWDGYDFGESIGNDVENGNPNFGFNQAQNYYPADIINKDPKIKNKSDDDVYIAFKLDFIDNENNKITRETFENMYGKLNIVEGFKEVASDNSSLFILNNKLSSNAISNLFTTVTLNNDIAVLQDGTLPTFKIEVTGYAVQGNVTSSVAETALIDLVKKK